MKKKILFSFIFSLLSVSHIFSQEEYKQEWLEIDNFGNTGRITDSELQQWTFQTTTQSQTLSPIPGKVTQRCNGFHIMGGPGKFNHKTRVSKSYQNLPEHNFLDIFIRIWFLDSWDRRSRFKIIVDNDKSTRKEFTFPGQSTNATQTLCGSEQRKDYILRLQSFTSHTDPDLLLEFVDDIEEQYQPRSWGISQYRLQLRRGKYDEKLLDGEEIIPIEEQEQTQQENNNNTIDDGEVIEDPVILTSEEDVPTGQNDEMEGTDGESINMNDQQQEQTEQEEDGEQDNNDGEEKEKEAPLHENGNEQEEEKDGETLVKMLEKQPIKRQVLSDTTNQGSGSDDNADSTSVFLAIFLPIIFIVIISVVVFLWIRRRRQNQGKIIPSEMNSQAGDRHTEIV